MLFHRLVHSERRALAEWELQESGVNVDLHAVYFADEQYEWCR